MKIIVLNSEYTAFIDESNEDAWNNIISNFRDATFNQTWAWCKIMSNDISNLVIKRNGSIVAAAILRLKILPVIKQGIAYIGGGPMWRLKGVEDDIDIFHHIIHALKEEYVIHRGLLLRISANIYTNFTDYQKISTVFETEKFLHTGQILNTMFIDMHPSLDDLRAGFHKKWRASLKNAEKNNLVIYKGEDDKTFSTFRRIYEEMIHMKQYDTPVDINKYELIFKALPATLKPIIIICESEGIPAAGIVISILGDTAIPMLLASGIKGRECNAAYLVQWEVLKALKQKNVSSYDLGGCSPEKNFNTYLFKYRMIDKNPVIHSQIGIMEACNKPFIQYAINSVIKLQKFFRISVKVILKNYNLI